jgi:phosphoribosylformimino-5-aminoimidazole carboxamide ribotide isomerase
VILYPAIDLKDGKCVRLVRGDMASATVFNHDPTAQARSFSAAGFDWLHIVDLNGAMAGHSVNGAAVAGIRAAVALHIQLGGGIRDRAAIEHWLGIGIDRVVLGTAALREPSLVKEAAANHPGRIAVAIDARAGRVAVEGWSRRPISMSSNWRTGSRIAGSLRSFIPTLPAMVRWGAWMPLQRPRSRASCGLR